jgi:hypothetical protein
MKPRPTFPELARSIVADPVGTAKYSAFTADEWRMAAQCYLDALAEGYDAPHDRVDLVWMLARDECEAPTGAIQSEGPNNGDSYAEGEYDNDEWFDLNRESMMASVERYYTQQVAA